MSKSKKQSKEQKQNTPAEIKNIDTYRLPHTLRFIAGQLDDYEDCDCRLFHENGKEPKELQGAEYAISNYKDVTKNIYEAEQYANKLQDKELVKEIIVCLNTALDSLGQADVPAEFTLENKEDSEAINCIYEAFRRTAPLVSEKLSRLASEVHYYLDYSHQKQQGTGAEKDNNDALEAKQPPVTNEVVKALAALAEPPIPKLSKIESEAYHLYRTGLCSTQAEVASRLSGEHKRNITQGQVSKYIQKAEKWMKQTGLPIETSGRPKQQSVNPDFFETGRRRDGLAERQRNKKPAE